MAHSLFSLNISNCTPQDILAKVKEEKIINIFLNVHKLVLINKEPLLRELVRKKEVALSVDGKIIEWLCFLKGIKVKKRFGGIDVLKAVCKEGRELKVFLLGAERQIIEKVYQTLYKKCKCEIVGFSDGYSFNLGKLKEKLRMLKVHILFVGLPSPKKELIGYELLKEIETLNGVVCIGGGFDVLGGKFSRAPVIMQNIGAEWLWRCLLDIKMFKRYFIDFIYLTKIIFYNFIKRRNNKGTLRYKNK